MSKSPGPLTRKVGLTDRSLLALKPAPVGKRVTVWDAQLPGMAVRVTDKGKRTFYAVRRRAGETSPTWALLGAYPVMKLGEAREAARAALGALVEGKDPTRSPRPGVAPRRIASGSVGVTWSARKPRRSPPR